MPGFEELDTVATLGDQMWAEEGPVVLINLFTVDAEDEAALLEAWAHDADFMKAQPGYISTQLHKGIPGSSSFVNYAVWEDVASFRNAKENPMKTKIHAIAGLIGFLTIMTFWSSTVLSELFGTHETIAAVKASILSGMFILIPAMAIAGGSGMSLGGKLANPRAVAKKKRMPWIAANGLLILVPAAFYLESKASVGAFDTSFYVVQGAELIAGMANLIMMGLNIRDGLIISGRIGRRQRGLP